MDIIVGKEPNKGLWCFPGGSLELGKRLRKNNSFYLSVFPNAIADVLAPKHQPIQ